MGSEKSNICSDLLDKYKPEQQLKVRKNISASEKGVTYTATVNPERETVVFQVDGCIVTGGNKSDRLILSASEGTDWLGHFIELKGCDIRHAIEQLEATLMCPEFNDKTLVRRFARIVGRSFPSNTGNPILEKARNRFREKYKCELKSLKSFQPDKI